MQKWQLQEAKARLSELVKEAVSQGPQVVTIRGEPAVVVISQREFNELTRQKLSLVEFMQRSPLKGVKLDVRRDRSAPREDPLL